MDENRLAVRNTVRFTIQGAPRAFTMQEMEEIVKDATDRWYHRLCMKPFRIPNGEFFIKEEKVDAGTAITITSISEFKNEFTFHLFKAMVYLGLAGQRPRWES